jgi:ABC-type antimicrobial peptide transport system permease subunit
VRGEPRDAIAAVRAKVKELEPLRSVFDIMALDERIGGAYAEHRMRMALVALFAVAALSLACLGVYGTLSYLVGLRRREVGLRLALGALRRDIVRQLVGESLRVVLLACAAGLALSLVFGRAWSSLLFGVSPSDPATLSGVVGVVLVAALVAAVIPSVRAALVEPMGVLRQE